MGQPPMKKFDFPSSMAEALKVQQVLIGAAEKLGYSEHSLFAIRLALDEALSNAVRHGNKNDIRKRVTVEYHVSDEEIRVSICDEGRGFKPAELPDPTAEENLERPCGRGVMLIKAYMTEVFYNDKGNCVTMVKTRSCKLPAG